jgi:hypothetical protein
VRLYSTPEVVSLVREAGYRVERIDADFDGGRSVTMDSRYVQIVAKPATTDSGYGTRDLSL